MVQRPSTRTLISLVLAALAIWVSGAARRSVGQGPSTAPSTVPPAPARSAGGTETLTPVDLEVDSAAPDSDGNGVFEPGESIDVAPTWRNDGETPREVAGSASRFAGPAGATYSLEVGAADYGSIPPGEAASCIATGACYRLGVDDPVMRPAMHWEAAFEEVLEESADTAKSWAVHIGESFVDVPPTNAFYSAIETLLHNGVTDGCGGSQYCPGGVNSRAQMPVFLLRAVEGADYVPPACVEGSEEFTDVPADSPFCPWIEELFRRDVVSGCGGGRYCPGSPVTRAQMAVFLLKSILGGNYMPPTCSGRFADVPCPSTFADWVEDLAARDITGGCSATAYCPGDPVRRGQMAAFVAKAAGLTLYGACGPKPSSANTGPRFDIERTLTASEALAELRETGELSRVLITGTLTLDGADGVGWVISDSILEPRDSWYGVRAYTNEPFTGSPSERPRFEYVEVRGAGATGHSNSSASFYGNDTIWRWSELYGDVDLFKVRHRVLVESTYAHDTYHPEGAHSDVVQIRAGTGSRFRCNNFVATVGYGTNIGGNANAVLQTGSVIGPIESEWHHNWVTGGHYTIRVSDCDSNVDYWFSGNRHGRVFTYGPVAGCSDGKTAGDNVWDDTGEVLW